MTVSPEIIERCLSNDPRGQEAFYKAYSAKMFGLCLRYCHNYSEAQDILQEGFIKIFRSLGTLKNPEAVDSWVRTVIINTALNHYEKHIRQMEKEALLNDDMTDATIPADALSKLSHGELLRIIQGLPAGYRTIFNMHVIDGYEHKEIAEMLGISVGTSKSQLNRAKKSVQKILNRIL
jgi:RNA polymerase sigma-70 factor (ECF subfamily)